MIALKVGCDFQWKYKTTGEHLVEKRLAAKEWAEIELALANNDS